MIKQGRGGRIIGACSSSGKKAGFVATPLLAHPEDEKYGGFGSYLKQLTNMPPGYEFPSPTTVSELVAYLIKPDSFVVTGESVNLCGTWTFD
ncbi:hypothetical protein EIP91_010016 [Steccherinum ochraceum]|uniref:Uncharacterized protein n=1 Tax=Steccherinum ochraceum TaxID=92696 RepID=A0A4R0RDE4_9APHY|nr:hypothetical protein EIP91_010016 [Steccherinum ochraceum]